MHKALCNKVAGLTPRDVGKLTYSEIATILDSEERGPLGAPGLSDEEAAVEIERWSRMSALEFIRNYER